MSMDREDKTIVDTSYRSNRIVAIPHMNIMDSFLELIKLVEKDLSPS